MYLSIYLSTDEMDMFYFEQVYCRWTLTKNYVHRLCCKIVHTWPFSKNQNDLIRRRQVLIRRQFDGNVTSEDDENSSINIMYPSHTLVRW